jgi:transcriptional regulator with XRE-family HTH domain
MELGQKLKQARLEANLSQRQLCDGIVTRNMLSQIENGAAHPSMDTLRHFAARLGKSISYFLEDEAVTSPNQTVMEAARTHFKSSDFAGVLGALEDYRSPDPIFDEEFYLLLALSRMALARDAIRENRLPYGESLLEQAAEAGTHTAYFTPALERERLLLLAQTTATVELATDDRELLLRAEIALRQGDFRRCLQILDAAEDPSAPKWHLLRGEACFAAGNYDSAVHHLTLAEESYPNQTVAKLEICYRELKIFEKAYEYACKQRN